VGRLEGKVAVLTGAGRGIGRATALRFAKEGAAVMINDVDPEPAEEAAASVKEAGGEVLVSTENTVDLDQARQLMSRTAERSGRWTS
jgi:3-oxoacyl-[acyl-carrier protein] reductase